MKKFIKGLLVLIPIIVLFIFIKVNANTTIATDLNRPGTTDTNSYYVTNQGTFTITSIQSGDKITAYKILDTYYNPNSNVITYEFTTPFKSYLNSSDKYKNYTIEDYQKLTSGSIEDGSTKTTSTLDTLVSGYASYIKSNSVTGTLMTTNNTTASASLEAGSYLALPTATSKIYAVMVGNIEFSESGGNWILNSANIVAKKSNASIYKTINDSTSLTSSRHINQNFKYNISLTIPQYPTNATNKVFKVVDVLSSGITFNGLSSLKVTDGTTELIVGTDGIVKDANNNTVATIAINEQTLTFEFNLDYVTSTKVIVSYSAYLNDNATLGPGDNGNKSTATLTYSNDPYGTGTKNASITAILYTFGLEIFVYDSSDKTKTLNNATFDIYTTWWPFNKIGTITTDKNGKAYFKGLMQGTYNLKQTKAANGYILMNDTIQAIVTPHNNNKVEGTIEGYYLTEIAIDKIGLLPITGGSGIIIFVVFGVLFTLVGIIGFIIYRKKLNQ